MEGAREVQKSDDRRYYNAALRNPNAWLSCSTGATASTSRAAEDEFADGLWIS
jgi:hypothetical protein